MNLQVLSVTLDEWSDDEVDAMIEVGGNASANSIYEAYIPEGVSKPGPDASHEERSKFIRLGSSNQPFSASNHFLLIFWKLIITSSPSFRLQNWVFVENSC